MGKLSFGVVPVTAFQQNCTLLFDEESRAGVVVDPGGDVPTIMRVIESNDLTIEAIWLTHGHIDHAGGAMDLKQKLGGVPIVGPHLDDKPLLEQLEQQARMFGSPDPATNCTPDQWLSEGDTVSFGDHRFDVYHTPGHAPGHVIFHNSANKFAQVGDTLFRGSVGRTDLWGGDTQTLIDSIRTKILPLGDDVSFICGHGPGGTLGEERRTNPFIAPGS
ncbi:MBL fold metallo-hydrolase [Notoacmeibacter sp. MSK16QG-6]|uniref:MBL fold metallo-hydrolase n=1 Tax=Notoacmeibacter sp. MSK16QG-6 TaxID=2957982 RepID=UPI00209F995B|nr:MBL fold metallo-hydrolase [Notoacmeibacter sp. MSK16QG-6]MCP1199858.1 MBL fold metallo-hydrolase [Notoacmeibacter sp. MSK16QG-6]